MAEKIYEDWVEAGRVGARALQVGIEACKEGTRYVDVVETVETFVADQGLAMSFPCTVSVNQVAAHFTPDHLDEHVLQRGDVVKVDCGAELRGALSDNARTVEVGSQDHADLIETSALCVDTAIGAIHAGCNLGDVGGLVEQVAVERGFTPIQNLTGHSLERYNLHAGLTVPSVQMRINRKPKVNDVLAVEPFVTDGTAGRVENSGVGNIYHFQSAAKVRMPAQRQVIETVARQHPVLPFSQRWITQAADPKKLNFHVNQLVRSGHLKHYPALSEASGGLVAQKEYTVWVHEDGCEILTKA